MNLYLISQNENTDYYSFESALVVADSPEDAASIHPCGREDMLFDTKGFYLVVDRGEKYYITDNWASHPSKVAVKYLGYAEYGIERGLVISQRRL